MFRDSVKSMLPLDSLSTPSGLSIFPSLINYHTFPDSDGQVIEKLTPVSKCLGVTVIAPHLMSRNSRFTRETVQNI